MFARRKRRRVVVHAANLMFEREGKLEPYAVDREDNPSQTLCGLLARSKAPAVINMWSRITCSRCIRILRDRPQLANRLHALHTLATTERPCAPSN